MLTGSCLCGNLRYKVPNEFEYALICHCSQCRRATGSAFKALAGIRIELVELIVGEMEPLIYGDESAHDVHCRECGSLLYSSVREHAYAHVTMGTLIDAPSIRPTAHIFVGSKASWHQISDDLPQFEEFPG